MPTEAANVAGPSFSISPLDETTMDWVRSFMGAHWGSEIIVVHGTTFRPAELPGYLATLTGEKIGLVTYHLEGEDCEIVTLDSLRPNMGVGSALILAVKQEAGRRGCRRLWLVTTNDNLHALRFYQRRGFALAALRRGAVEASRRIKPEIPLVGEDGIPIRDEIELEMRL